jgi:ribosomal protein S18 acetylase RimI-like enzyme
MEMMVTDANSPFRPATKADARLLAELVNEAGDGLPFYVWSKYAQAGETPWDIGQDRAARETSDFSYRNATLIEQDGAAAGCLIGYDIPETAKPITPDTPALFRPLLELENLALGTWYINVLAVLPGFRNLGLGTKLLQRAEEIAAQHRKHGLSLIVSDANPGAWRLYERSGYRACDARPMVKEGWVNEGQNWVLMKKGL